MKKTRAPVLEKFKPIWLTEEAHQLLKIQKKKQKKSMMQLVENLIKEKYGLGESQKKPLPEVP